MNFKQTALRSGLLVLALSANTALAADTNPTISLFPSTVKQDLRESVEATKRMEEGIEPIIAQMETTQQMFKAAQCDGAAADPGCAAIKKQLQQQYLDMLEEVDSVLPDVETSIRATHSSLGRSITSTLGVTKTPYDLQHEFLKQNNAIPDRIRSRKRGLSKRLEGLLRLTSQKSDPSTTLVMASEFFLDASDSLAIISQARAAIAQAKTQAALDLELGAISEDMLATVDSVKEIIDPTVVDEITPDTLLEEESEPGFNESDYIY